jgi:2',3'-cyclic-nucleotide 2'-phosphodiesterase (5'-nucleotidase family)
VIEGQPRVSQTAVDESVPADPALEDLLKPYTAKVRALETVIGRLEGDLKKSGAGAGSLGNFVTDGMRVYSSRKLGQPVTLAIVNSGGLRKNTFAQGEIRASDIFELLPFENALISMDMDGEHLLKLLEVVVADKDAQSGARLTYEINAEKQPRLVRAKLVDDKGVESAIDPGKTYKVITIDYLLKLQSGRYKILQDVKNIQPLGATIRDAMMEYVKAETQAGRPLKAKLDGRFFNPSGDAESEDPK